MILYACKEGEKIIMPRNVHRSAINALIVSGAIPVYVDPGIDANLGIPLGMSVKSALKAMDENPDAKAVLVNNPTYYGVCSDLRSIVSLAHERGMLALADEAHGTHFYFRAYARHRQWNAAQTCRRRACTSRAEASRKVRYCFAPARLTRAECAR